MLQFKIYIFTALVISLFSLNVTAQVNLNETKNREMKAAIILYNSREFLLAAEKIEAYRENESGSYDDTLALRLLGDCYWKLRNYKKSKFYYENLLIATKFLSPTSKLHLAQLYAMNADYEKASRLLIGMKEENILQGFQNPEQFYKDSLDYNIQFLDNSKILNKKNITPILVEDSLFWTMEGQDLPLVTVSKLNSLRKNKKRKSKNNSIIDDNFTSTVFSPVRVSYFPTTKKVYFTIKNDVNDLRHLRIAEADIKGSAISDLLIFSLGPGEYTMINPVISPDGSVLIFLSDKNNNQFDIYYCLKTKDSWTRPFPVNSINTSGDELFPTFDANGNLYFNSNGRSGLGGLDIYKVKLKILGGDDIVYHLPYPINSSNDDFNFTTTDDGDNGYFISNRQGKDDFYYYNFKMKYVNVTGALKYDVSNKAVKDKLIFIYEKFQSANGEDGWSLKDSIRTDNEGNYQFKGRPNSSYKAVNSNEIDKFELFFETYDNLEPLTLETILLEDKDKPKNPVVENKDSVLNKFVINYEFGKATLSENSKIVLDSLVTYLKNNPTLFGIAASFTDCSGKASYNLKLSAKRSNEMKAYLLRNGIPATRIKESHFGNEFLINPCSELNYKSSTQTVNRRTEIYVTSTDTLTWVKIKSDSSVNLAPINESIFNEKSEKKPVKEIKVLPKVDILPRLELSPKPDLNKANKVDSYSKSNPTIVKIEENKINTANINITGTPAFSEKNNENLSKSTAKQSSVRSFISKQYAPTLSASKEINSRDQKIMSSLSKSMSVINNEQSRIAKYLSERENKKSIMLTTFSDSVYIEIYDNGIYDHDTISVIFNNQLIVDRKEIGTNVKDPIRFAIKLDDDQSKNQMVIIAENLGTEAPNSALLIVRDKQNKQSKIYLTTDMLHNEVVYFIKLTKR